MRKRYSVARSLSGGPAEAAALTVTSKALSVMGDHVEKARRVNRILARDAEEEAEPEEVNTEAANDADTVPMPAFMQEEPV